MLGLHGVDHWRHRLRNHQSKIEKSQEGGFYFSSPRGILAMTHQSLTEGASNTFFMPLVSCIGFGKWMFCNLDRVDAEIFGTNLRTT